MRRPRGWLVLPPVGLLAAVVVPAVVTRTVGAEPALPAVLETWLAVMLAITLQAAPFLALGVIISGAISAFVPAWFLQRMMPRTAQGAVPAAGLAGAVLPGCECASVPVSNALIRHGVPSGAALTFMLASPAINPVVVVATLVAFPDEPMIAIARFLAGFLAAVAVGLVWTRLRGERWMPEVPEFVEVTRQRWRVFRRQALHDFLHAGGYLVVGAMVAATVNVVVPTHVLDFLADNWLIAVLTMAVLAVVVAVCSEADAFVAASLTAFSPTAKLVFMTVSPMVDIKLVAMQGGTFGRDFVLRFAPLTFLVAIVSAVVVGWVLL